MSVTAQQIFDKVTTHLRQQRLKAKTRFDCVYLDMDTGHRCAVGCLLDGLEDLDGISLESINAVGSIEGLLEHFPSRYRQIDPSEDMALYPLLAALQTAHDDLMPTLEGGPMASWETAMQEAAAEFGLTYTEPTP